MESWWIVCLFDNIFLLVHIILSWSLMISVSCNYMGNSLETCIMFRHQSLNWTCICKCCLSKNQQFFFRHQYYSSRHHTVTENKPFPGRERKDPGGNYSEYFVTSWASWDAGPRGFNSDGQRLSSRKHLRKITTKISRKLAEIAIPRNHMKTDCQQQVREQLM